MIKKVLIVTYYWPPSGGAGVQRWLKMSKYLAEQGVEVHVLTVDSKSASYTDWDESLLKDIHPSITVHTTKSIEPNSLYGKLVGRKKIPKAGFSNVDNESAFLKIATTIRSNLFIPDPRRPWNYFAIKKGKAILEKYGIKNVITTSPPHSTQLIGLALKKTMNINWIADLRDPWTDIYYYDLLRHSRWSHGVNSRLEAKVIEQCDQMITVSNGFLELFKQKIDQGITPKSHIITNGYDANDFENLTKQSTTSVITYTGTMSEKYNVEVFFQAFAECDTDIKLLLVGTFSQDIHNYIDKYKLNNRTEIKSPVPHSEVVQIQKDAMILLLVNPDIKEDKGILPGKIFEYMATQNPILALGSKDSDINTLLEETNAGKLFERNQKEAIKRFITDIHKGQSLTIDKSEVEKYSRKYLAGRVWELLV